MKKNGSHIKEDGAELPEIGWNLLREQLKGLKVIEHLEENPEKLVEVLQAEQDNDVRLRIIALVGQTGDKRMIQPLLKVLRNEDPHVRLVAIYALSIICADDIDPLLKALREEEDINTRIFIIMAIGNSKNKRAIEPLVQILNRDKTREVRAAAAQALGQIGDPRAVEPLILSLNRDKSRDVRVSAAQALGQIGDPQAVDPLIRALEDDEPMVRTIALSSLEAIGDDRAIPVIQKLLETEKDEYVRDEIYRTLERLRADKVIKSAESATQKLEKLREEKDIAAAVSVKISEIIAPLKEDITHLKKFQKDVEEKSPGLRHGLSYFEKFFQAKMELYYEKISRIDEKITGHIETHEQQEEIHRHRESLFWIKVGVFVAIVIPVIISLVSLYYTFNPP